MGGIDTRPFLKNVRDAHTELIAAKRRETQRADSAPTTSQERYDRALRKHCEVKAAFYSAKAELNALGNDFRDTKAELIAAKRRLRRDPASRRHGPPQRASS